jgi:hypothetical protein
MTDAPPNDDYPIDPVNAAFDFLRQVTSDDKSASPLTGYADNFKIMMDGAAKSMESDCKVYADCFDTPEGKALFEHLASTILTQSLLPHMEAKTKDDYLFACIHRDAQRQLVIEMFQAVKRFRELNQEPDEDEE